MKVTHLDVADVVREQKLVIKARFRNTTRFRIWLAAKLFIFAAWVGGFGGVEIEDVSDAC